MNEKRVSEPPFVTYLKKMILERIRKNREKMKFRIMGESERDVENTVRHIKNIILFSEDVFDVDTKKYPDGWAVRFSWSKTLSATPFDLGPGSENRFGFIFRGLEGVKTVTLHHDVAEAIGIVGAGQVKKK